MKTKIGIAAVLLSVTLFGTPSAFASVSNARVDASACPEAEQSAVVDALWNPVTGALQHATLAFVSSQSSFGNPATGGPLEEIISSTRSDPGTEYSACWVVNGTCTITVHERTTTVSKGWHVLVLWNMKKIVRVDATTQIDCGGENSVTMSHWGGFGPRAVTQHQLTTGFYDEGQWTTVRETDLKDSCSYVGLAGERIKGISECTTEISGPWELHVTVDGVPEGFGLCSTSGAVNEFGVPLGGITEGTILDQGIADSTHCYDAVDLA